MHTHVHTLGHTLQVLVLVWKRSPFFKFVALTYMLYSRGGEALRSVLGVCGGYQTTKLITIWAICALEPSPRSQAILIFLV